MRAGYFRSRALESVNDVADSQDREGVDLMGRNSCIPYKVKRKVLVRSAAVLIRSIEQLDRENS